MHVLISVHLQREPACGLPARVLCCHLHPVCVYQPGVAQRTDSPRWGASVVGAAPPTTPKRSWASQWGQIANWNMARELLYSVINHIFIIFLSNTPLCCPLFTFRRRLQARESLRSLPQPSQPRLIHRLRTKRSLNRPTCPQTRLMIQIWKKRRERQPKTQTPTMEHKVWRTNCLRSGFIDYACRHEL